MGRPAQLTEEERQRIEKHHRMVVEMAPDAVVTVDEMGQILFANSATTKIFGYSIAELIGRSLMALAPESLRKTYKTAMLDYLATGQRRVKAHGIELIGLRKNGEEFPVETSFSETEEKGTRIFTGFIRDITERKRAEDTLRASEDRYRDLVENSSDLICTHDVHGVLLSVNELPLRVLGYSREEILNKPLRDFVTPETRQLCDAYLAQIQRDGSSRGVLHILTKNGEVRLWEFNNFLRKEGVKSPVVRGLAHDVTEQKRAEAALRKSEEKFSKTFRSSPVEMVITTLADGRFLDVNESFERNIGFGRDEVIGRTSLELGLWIDPGERVVIVEEVKKNGRVANREIQIRAKSGEIGIKLYSAELLEIGTEQCLLAVSEDITARKRAEEDIRQLSGQLLRLHDEEQRRLARELHDTTGQALIAMATLLSQIHSLIPPSKRKLSRLITQCEESTNQSIQEIRTLSYVLFPPMLDQAGIESAVRHYADGFVERTRIRVELEVSPCFKRMPREIELVLFRVVQESLTNIQRHSESHIARIRLDRRPGIVLLEVSDKGRGIPGFEGKGSEVFPPTVGVGISSMIERVKHVGGRLEIESSEVGTTICVTVPINEQTHQENSHFAS